jgi:hypothetical protein
MTDTPELLPKRLTAARLAGVPELELAFRDVSGENDVSDGEGVREPSRGRPVQLLQESLLAMGYELAGGADGLYGPATQQAVLQFQIDAGHPWPAGQEWEHIGGISGSNTLAHFDMFDPGGTVGSHEPVDTGTPATAVTVLESPDHAFMGFDETTSPPSLVVGTTTRRRVRVEREPADSDVRFEVGDPQVATVGLTHEGIVVGGESAGTTTVRALAGDALLGELLVNVKDAREAAVNFLFLEGSTQRDHEKATLLTLRLNRLWRRQANVHFTLGIVQDVAVPDVLRLEASPAKPSTPGRKTRSPSAPLGPVVGAADAAHLRALAVPGDLNVVCVGVWDGTGYDPTQADPFLFFLPDRDCPDGMDLVRGAGVYLGGGPQPACGSGEERRRISKATADRVNPSGT